jgi:hypothetical protein
MTTETKTTYHQGRNFVRLLNTVVEARKKGMFYFYCAFILLVSCELTLDELRLKSLTKITDENRKRSQVSRTVAIFHFSNFETSSFRNT